jgi:hypothetical protein
MKNELFVRLAMIKFIEMLTHLGNHVPGPNNQSQTVYVSGQMRLKAGSSTKVEMLLMYARDLGSVLKPQARIGIGVFQR